LISVGKEKKGHFEKEKKLMRSREKAISIQRNLKKKEGIQ